MSISIKELTAVEVTIHTIMLAIKRNGLEKTLEDLQKVCPNSPPDYNYDDKKEESAYRGMLALLIIAKETYEKPI